MTLLRSRFVGTATAVLNLGGITLSPIRTSCIRDSASTSATRCPGSGAPSRRRSRSPPPRRGAGRLDQQAGSVSRRRRAPARGRTLSPGPRSPARRGPRSPPSREAAGRPPRDGRSKTGPPAGGTARPEDGGRGQEASRRRRQVRRASADHLEDRPGNGRVTGSSGSGQLGDEEGAALRGSVRASMYQHLPSAVVTDSIKRTLSPKKPPPRPDLVRTHAEAGATEAPQRWRSRSPPMAAVGRREDSLAIGNKRDSRTVTLDDREPVSRISFERR